MYQNPKGQSRPNMPSIVKILRVVADPNRLRILLLLRAEELSVAELQEILTMGQSTISTPVSYTHLDVYKRQVHGDPGPATPASL